MDIKITNGQLTATINPKGAELNSLKNDSTEFIWEGDPEFWGKHSPVLFPIVGTLKNNSYLYKGQVHALSRHGFARDNVFNLKEQTESTATFTLSSNNDTKIQYPFDFELELKYTLQNNTLRLDYFVTNKGDEAMPFSIGAHPAFALPGNFRDYSLKFEKNEPLVSTQLENDLISDKTVTLPAQDGILPLSYDLFKNDALIFKQLESDAITIQKNGSDYIKVSFPDFPHMGIWTKQDAPFLCIEPWQGYSDAATSLGNLIEKEGIVLLEPGKQYSAGFTVAVFS
ncbi:aldose 1-epimerase family protein [Flavobacterium zepuense]|uniref:Aldose 1-epimerase family protein n=1 Tax=Flavobacterium zepuense TaxID=2593302 RepID=A0A552UYS9_9FLAO|nr:aldose 1-epimerase family protein [Flavobacterium zepuense]TRW23406.1 aldose 1-epimerase family protein [Flavobacterium zepuense]